MDDSLTFSKLLSFSSSSEEGEEEDESFPNRSGV